jgi:hypothetical protein
MCHCNRVTRVIRLEKRWNKREVRVKRNKEQIRVLLRVGRSRNVWRTESSAAEILLRFMRFTSTGCCAPVHGVWCTNVSRLETKHLPFISIPKQSWTSSCTWISQFGDAGMDNPLLNGIREISSEWRKMQKRFSCARYSAWSYVLRYGYNYKGNLQEVARSKARNNVYFLSACDEGSHSIEYR